MIIIGVCLIFSLALNGLQLWLHRKTEKDLLDRIMARDYVEYAANAKVQNRPLKKVSMSDEREAEIEKTRKFAQSGALNV